jgi:hypothetical protein
MFFVLLNIDLLILIFSVHYMKSKAAWDELKEPLFIELC